MTKRTGPHAEAAIAVEQPHVVAVPGRRITVALVDDHALVRKGFRRILEIEPDIAVVGEAGDVPTAVELVQAERPAVVLMDISLPPTDGIEATRAILAVAPDTRVLVLTMHADDAYVRRTLKAGARGYLVKDADAGDLVQAVRAVHAGGSFFSPQVANLLRDSYLYGSSKDVIDNLGLLSPREREVMRLVADGYTNRLVAETLGITVNTVESHRKQIMDKLGLRNTADMVRFALKKGLVS